MVEDRVIATNRQAYHYYTILESLEAGIELKGSEVKSLREGKANLKDSFARIEKEEIFLHNLHITPYRHVSFDIPDPVRVRKLLLHKNEIIKLSAKVFQKGFTLIPLKLYFKKGKVKVELALAKGKKLYDRREVLRRKEVEKDTKRALREKE